jgi:Zn ribbon nucleic-acid-binding protein
MEFFVVSVVCSACGEETEVTVEDLDDVDREACECGYSYVVLSVAEFEPVHKKGQLVELPRRDDGLSRAA